MTRTVREWARDLAAGHPSPPDCVECEHPFWDHEATQGDVSCTLCVGAADCTCDFYTPPDGYICHLTQHELLVIMPPVETVRDLLRHPRWQSDMVLGILGIILMAFGWPTIAAAVYAVIMLRLVIWPPRFLMPDSGDQQRTLTGGAP